MYGKSSTLTKLLKGKSVKMSLTQSLNNSGADANDDGRRGLDLSLMTPQHSSSSTSSSSVVAPPASSGAAPYSSPSSHPASSNNDPFSSVPSVNSSLKATPGQSLLNLSVSSNISASDDLSGLNASSYSAAAELLSNASFETQLGEDSFAADRSRAAAGREGGQVVTPPGGGRLLPLPPTPDASLYASPLQSASPRNLSSSSYLRLPSSLPPPSSSSSASSMPSSAGQSSSRLAVGRRTPPTPSDSVCSISPVECDGGGGATHLSTPHSYYTNGTGGAKTTTTTTTGRGNKSGGVKDKSAVTAKDKSAVSADLAEDFDATDDDDVENGNDNGPTADNDDDDDEVFDDGEGGYDEEFDYDDYGGEGGVLHEQESFRDEGGVDIMEEPRQQQQQHHQRDEFPDTSVDLPPRPAPSVRPVGRVPAPRPSLTNLDVDGGGGAVPRPGRTTAGFERLSFAADADDQQQQQQQQLSTVHVQRPPPKLPPATTFRQPAPKAAGSGKTVAKFVYDPTKPRYVQWAGKAKFCCAGKCMFGPNYRQFSVTFSLTIVTLGLFCALVFPRLQTSQVAADVLHLGATPSTSALYVGATVCGTAICMVIFLFLTAMTDPGIIPRRNPSSLIDSMALAVKERMNYCPTCHIVRPERTKHCRQTDCCIKVFDHHCPWTGNSVGRRNYKYFIAFIFFTACSSIINALAAALLIYATVTKMKRGEATDWVGIVAGPVLTLWNTFVFSLVGALLGFHIYLIYKGQTTNEFLRGERKGVIKARNPGSFTFPFIMECLSLWCGESVESLLGDMSEPPNIVDEEVRDIESQEEAIDMLKEVVAPTERDVKNRNY